MNKKNLTKALAVLGVVAVLGAGFIGARGQNGAIDPPFGFKGIETRGQNGNIDPPFGFNNVNTRGQHGTIDPPFGLMGLRK